MKFKTIVKKVLSIVLTISLLLTLGAGNVSVNADQNQKITWLQYNYNKTIEETDDSCYGGYAVLNKTVAYQNLYTPIDLEPDELYKATFSIKVNAITRIEVFAVAKDAEVPWGSSALTSTSDTLVDYKVYRNYTTSETEWTDISVEFETVSTENVQYYINILFGDGGTTNTATVSDFSLKKIEKVNWLQYKWNTYLVETDDSRYGGYAVLNTTIAHQNLYTAVETAPDEIYSVSFSIKANEINRIEIFAVAKGAEVPWGGSALTSTSDTLVDYKVYRNYPTSETEWTDISVKFETVSTENVQYYINILFGDGGTSNTATVSDFSLKKIEKINWLQYKWNTYLEETDDSCYGGYAIYNTSVASQNLYTPIDVEPGELYKATFSIKVNAIKRIQFFAVPKGAEVPWGSSALTSTSDTLVDYKAYENFTTSETEWTDISVEFETVNTEDVQYYINILFGDGGTTNAATVSDFSLKKINIPKVDDIAPFIGNSIRTSDSQALRYKFSFDKSALKIEYSGYSIVEYGFISVYDKYLTDEYGELTFNGNGELTNKKSVQGISYQKSTEKDIVFDETDDAKIVSVALTNIGLKNNSINYDTYSKGLTVRAYIIFENAKGERIYKYGTGYSASVFETMRTILLMDEQSAVEGGYDWETVQQDQTAINEILSSVANDADKSTELTVGYYYNLYVANKTE